MLFDRYNDLRRTSFMQKDSKTLDHKGILKNRKIPHFRNGKEKLESQEDTETGD